MVSVIIVNWNSRDLLHQCLGRLGEQTLTPERVLVIDNGSLDNPTEIITLFSGVDLYQAGCNLGFAAANNLAIPECDSD